MQAEGKSVKWQGFLNQVSWVIEVIYREILLSKKGQNIINIITALIELNEW